METSKISIVIPAYNIANYVERCLESILTQTYQNLEIIIVDDGSTDGTGEILDRCAEQDARIKVLHQENTGVTKARFNGIRHATGDWIGFVDGDDYIERDMYARLIKNAEKYGTDISHCGYRMVFPDRVDYYYNTGSLALQDELTGLKDLLEGSRIEPGLWNKLFHKTLLHSLFHRGVEDSGIKINEDLLMNFYLFRASNKSVFEDFCPYHYMVRKGSAATSKKAHHYTDPLRVMKQIYKEVENNLPLSQVAYSRYLYILLNASIQKEYEDIRKNCHKELKEECKKGLKTGSLKLKIMAYLVAYVRPIYVMIRKLYEMVTGINHKYDVE